MADVPMPRDLSEEAVAEWLLSAWDPAYGAKGAFKAQARAVRALLRAKVREAVEVALAMARERGTYAVYHDDVIDRVLVLWSNPGETVLTPFAGVGSEVYSAVRNGRRGVGAELKSSYYRQMVRNVADALKPRGADECDPLLAAIKTDVDESEES